jgi:hypothetical protein
MSSSNNVWAGIGNSNTRSNNAAAASIVGAAAIPTNLVWQSVDDLGSVAYTFSDPNALLTSYTYNSATDEHTFDLVTVNPSVADYAINAGLNFTGPRWYKGLTDAAGAPVLAGDRFELFLRFTNFSVAGGLTQWGAYCGVAGVPASTVLLTLQANGAWMGVTGVGTPNLGAHAVNTATTVSLASATSGRANASFSGAPTREKAGVTGLITSAAAQDSAVRADGTVWAGTVTDSTQVSLFLCATTLGTVVTTAGTLTTKIEYAVLRIS